MPPMNPTNELVCPLSTQHLCQRVLAFVEHCAATTIIMPDDTRVVSPFEFYSYQRVGALRIIESLLLNEGETITELWSRQSGKSQKLAALGVGLTIICPVLARAFPHDERLARLAKIRIGVFGPNQDSTGPIFERMRQLAEGEHVRDICADPEIGMYLVQSRGDSLSWNLGSYVKAKTASENAYVEGGTFHLIFIDEAQKVSPAKVRKEISPMLASTNGTMVKIGTAWMARGGFHNDIQTNVLVERNGGKQSHFEFDYEVVCREKRATYERQRKAYEAGTRDQPPNPEHLMYEKYIATEIRKLGGPGRGENTEEFKMNFRLLWQESRQIAISDDELAAAALKTVDVVVGARRGVIIGGLDVAKTNDSTVLTVGDVDFAVPLHEADMAKVQAAPAAVHYTKNVLAWLELQGSFEKLQYNAIVEFCAKFAMRKLVVDATGMGDPVCERLGVLLAPLEIEVIPFVYSTSSKSDLFKLYLQEFKAGRFRYPAAAATQETVEFRHFVEQHADLTRTFNGNYLVCSASEEDLHDDYPCSAALMCFAARDVASERELPTMQVDTHGVASGTRYGGSSRHDRYRMRR